MCSGLKTISAVVVAGMEVAVVESSYPLRPSFEPDSLQSAFALPNACLRPAPLKKDALLSTGNMVEPAK